MKKSPMSLPHEKPAIWIPNPSIRIPVDFHRVEVGALGAAVHACERCDGLGTRVQLTERCWKSQGFSWKMIYTWSPQKKWGGDDRKKWVAFFPHLCWACFLFNGNKQTKKNQHRDTVGIYSGYDPE